MSTSVATYKIETIYDFLAVPQDRLADCLAEFGDFLDAGRHVIGIVAQRVKGDDGLPCKPTLKGFLWTDDGERRCTIRLRNPGLNCLSASMPARTAGSPSLSTHWLDVLLRDFEAFALRQRAQYRTVNNDLGANYWSGYLFAIRTVQNMVEAESNTVGRPQAVASRGEPAGSAICLCQQCAADLDRAPAAARTADAVLADAVASAIVREFHICETANPDGRLRRLPDEQARAEIAGLVQIVAANARRTFDAPKETP